MEYILEKKIWTDADFERMGWHDADIYKIAVSKDLELDIDYIFQWNQPEVPGMSFTFWIAPATLVFKDIKDLKFDFELIIDDAFQIDYIEREASECGTIWRIITQRGEMEFIAGGFEQYIRQQPSFQYGQAIGYTERGGLSLERTTDQKNAYILTEDYKTKRARTDELYSYAKKHRQKKSELEALQSKRDAGEIGTKYYLQQKKN